MVIRIRKTSKSGRTRTVYFKAVENDKLKTTQKCEEAYDEGDGYFLHAQYDWLKFHFPEEMKDSDIYDLEYDEIVPSEEDNDEDEDFWN